jgi:prepilin-type processing-associated H-X9-DG protein
MFMAYTPPNSTITDYMIGYCKYPFMTNPPCKSTSTAFNAARSLHPGGVNALMGDGRVQFMKNSVNANTWRGLSTMSGGEIISADAL